MNAKPPACASARKKRYQNQADQLLQKCNAEAYEMMQAFTRQSSSFLALRTQIIDDYFVKQPLNPAFCARALESLVERVIETMQEDLQSAA